MGSQAINSGKAYRHRGFTLIELLVVIAIIAILAIIAVPSYQAHMSKTRRIDGQAALLDLANHMERYYAQNNTYASATLASNNATTDVLQSDESPQQWYILSITEQTATNYTLQATPQATQGKHDKKCQSLTLNHLGAKGLTKGPSGTPTDSAINCW